MAHETVASLAVASAVSTLAPLGGVASLGAPMPGNPGNRGMEATLGLRASPTACRTAGQLSSSKSAGTQVQLGRRSCLFFRTWESRSDVLCEYIIRLNWFLAVCTVCTVCTQYTPSAQAKLVLSSSAVLVGRTVVFAVYNATAKLNQWRHLALNSELPGKIT